MSEVFLTRDEIEHPYANLTVMLEDKRKKAEQMRRTVFARITASPQVLAPKFVYEYTLNPPASDGTTKLFRSLLTGKNYYTKSEAIAATLMKLKEVAE